MSYTLYRRMIFLIAVSLTLTTFSLRITAQNIASKFTVDDLLEVTNINIADLSDDGQWLVATTGSLRDRIGNDNSRFGDANYIAPALSDLWVIETITGKKQKLFQNKQQVFNMKWSPAGDRLALFVRKGDLKEPMIWERRTGKFTTISLPAGKQAANNTAFYWSADGSQVMFALWKDSIRQKAASDFKHETKGPIVVHSSKEPFLAWDELRRIILVRSFVSYDLKTGKLREVLPEAKLSSFRLVGDGSSLVYLEDITKKTDYDVIGGTDNQAYLLNTVTGERRSIIKSTKGLNIFWSQDNNRYAYAKDGSIFIASVGDKEMQQLTGKKMDTVKGNTTPDKPKDDTTSKAGNDKKEKEKFSITSLSPKGDWLVVSNKEGMWLMNAATGEKEIIIKISEEDKEAPTYQVVDWSPAADLIYFNYSSKTKWERGLVRYSVKDKKLEDLLKDSRLYNEFRLSKDGSTFIYNSSASNQPADLYVADADFKNFRRLSEINPQLKSKSLSKTELVSYLDVDGNKMYGVLYYPVDYEQGKKYPTVFIIYEQFFDDFFSGTINILTSNGYAVMQPSVSLEIGFPGEAWMKGVSSAANKLIDMGIADAERLGVQGTSYGGYATNLLITQTNRFKAAINISGKVNMISFYTGSPRLGVRNIHAPEKSQDRIGATLWQQPQKYIQQSAIMFADRIKTPLLLMSGEQDYNVPATQSMEMYYALRRLDKEVEWVSYTNSGHGMPTYTIEEVRDYHKRIIDWYDSHLKGDLKKKAEEKKAFASAQE
jgi:dipeptidyl aminopeptidase/acylaminoacyl peptidase